MRTDNLLPTPRPLSRWPHRATVVGWILFADGTALLLWLGTTQVSMPRAVWLGVSVNSLAVLLAIANVALRRRRYAARGYALEKWETMSIGRPPAWKWESPSGSSRRERAARVVPTRDEVMVAPAFAGLSDAEALNLAIAMLVDTVSRSDDRDAARKGSA